MDPNESIVGMKGLKKAMRALYGPNFDSLNYTPLFNNIRTGALMSKPHHCTYNDAKGHQMTRRCVTEGHQGYCIEWVDEGECRVRCGQRLKIESGGCGTHPANNMEDSMNLKVKNLVAGKFPSIIWSELNDPKRPKDSGFQTTPTAKQQIKAQADEKLAEMDTAKEQETVAGLPVADLDAYSVHVAFVEHKKAEERSIAEERKANAAAKRSGVIAKAKKATTKIFTSENPLDRKLREGKSYKSGHKNRKPDADTFKNKRGGKNALDSFSGQENHVLGRK
jgi:hypothetical protein